MRYVLFILLINKGGFWDFYWYDVISVRLFRLVNRGVGMKI